MPGDSPSRKHLNNEGLLYLSVHAYLSARALFSESLHRKKGLVGKYNMTHDGMSYQVYLWEYFLRDDSICHELR